MILSPSQWLYFYHIAQKCAPLCSDSVKNKFHHLLLPRKMTLLCIIFNGFSPEFFPLGFMLHVLGFLHSICDFMKHFTLSDQFSLTFLYQVVHKKTLLICLMSQTSRYFMLRVDADFSLLCKNIFLDQNLHRDYNAYIFRENGQDLTGARNNLSNEKLMFLTVPQEKLFYFHQLIYPYHTTVISK